MGGECTPIRVVHNGRYVTYWGDSRCLSRHAPQHRFGRRLAEFSYRFNRRFSLREMFPRLAYVALRTSPMPYRVLKLAENYA